MSADVPRLLEALGVQYRNHGTELWGPCPHPDHRETRPSWSIKHAPHEPTNGTHYCFGCQFTGGPIDLVSAVIGITYGSAKQWITDRGLWLKGTLPLAVQFEIRGRYATSLRIPGGLISGPLERWATPVRKYAIKRGLNPFQVQRWSLCYAVDGDMAGRIVFPCQDTDTQWLSWHARTYCNQDKRFKNASHSDGYDPGAVFGMRWWPSHEARTTSTLVLTEGALDALACERAGAEFICAIGGSDPHARQLLKLSAWGTILVATDGDKAGQKLFLTLRHAIGARCDIRRVDIPSGTDAAAIAKTDLSVLKELLCRASVNGSGASEKRSAALSPVSRRRLVRAGTGQKKPGSS